MSALLAAMVLSDVLLAVVTFLCLARPEVGEELVARAAGLHRRRLLGELSDAEEERIRWAGGLLGKPLLVVVFGWSVAVGIVMAAGRGP